MIRMVYGVVDVSEPRGNCHVYVKVTALGWYAWIPYHVLQTSTNQPKTTPLLPHNQKKIKQIKEQ